jgi:hypothetical protein
LSQAGDSTPEELANATQVQGNYMPSPVARSAQMNQSQLGARLKKAAEAEVEKK